MIIVSDACRTPAQNLDTQYITGVSAFALYPFDAQEQRVEIFYATAPGRAAAELNTIASEGIYTDILIDALIGVLHDAQGAEQQVLEQAADDGAHYIWSDPLASYLEKAIPRRIIDLGLDIAQEPRAVIPSGRGEWLARIDDARAAVFEAPPPTDHSLFPPGWTWGGGSAPPAMGRDLQRQRYFLTEAITVRQIATELMKSLVQGIPGNFRAALSWASRAPAPGAAQFIDEVEALAEPHPASPTNAQTALRVRGPGIVFEDSRGELIQRASDVLEWVAPLADVRHPVNAVVELGNRTVAVVPVLKGYVADVIIRNREIASLSYEPTYPTADGSRLERARLLRAVVTASVRQGHYDLADAGLIGVRALQLAKDIDPAMAVLAAYGYHELQESSRIEGMDAALRRQLGGPTLFDVGLLIGRFSMWTAPNVGGGRIHGAFPFVPLLSQGWELAEVFGVGDVGWLERVRPYLVPSMWTVFDTGATQLLRQHAIGDL